MIRMLIIACLGILLFAADGLSAQEIVVKKASKINIKPESWDFGKIPEQNILTRDFEVQNTGNDLLTIKNIAVSCGCTTVSISSKDISPGRSATLNVKIDTRQINSSGKSTRHVYVESNDPQEPTKAISLTLELEAAKESKPVSNREVKVSHKAKIVSVSKISSRKLYSLIKKGKRVIILDVREENEYVGKHIPEAIWFPKSKFDKQDKDVLKKLEGMDKKTTVVTYCGAGHRSNYVAKKLGQMGYNAYNLDGISFWEKEGLPLIRGAKLPPTEEPTIIHLEEAYENYYATFNQ